MDRAHLNGIAKRLDELAKFTKKNLPPGIAKTYLDYLAPLTGEEVSRAFDTWIFKSTRFPSVEDLLDCCGRSPKKRAESLWPSIELRRDRIADDVCRQSKLLVTLNTANRLSDYEGGSIRRDAKKQFIEAYEQSWLRWWSEGRIEEGESMLDLTPARPPRKEIPKEDLITPEQFRLLKQKIALLGGAQLPEEDIPF